MSTWSDFIGFACVALAAIGCIYALAAAALMPRLEDAATAPRTPQPGVTILKPLRGAESSLADNLRSFCVQRYDSPVQLLFGVEDEGDPAAVIVRALAVENPSRDIALVAGSAPTSANPKVGTLMTLEPRIRHEVVVLADSDINVPPDYLTRIVAALQGPDVGLVTCLYRGAPGAGVWGRLAAMAIDHHFLPNVIVGVRLGLARPCFGSTEKFDPVVNWASKVDMDKGSKTYGRPLVQKPSTPPSRTVRIPTPRVSAPPLSAPRTSSLRPYSPKTNLFYVPTNHVCMDYEPFRVSYTPGQPYVGATLAMYPAPNSHGGMGNFIAWDGVAGKIKWSNQVGCVVGRSPHRW